MIETASSRRIASAASANDEGLQAAIDLASRIRDQWHGGAAPDLAGALASHPELKRHRTIVLELGFEEYCLRLKAGERLDPDEFSERFRFLRHSLCCFIVAHRVVRGKRRYAELQAAVPWPDAGSQFLGYELLEEIGRGTLGRVFLAAEQALGRRQVVLKVALEGSREAEIQGRLEHANIVPVYSVGKDEASGLTAFSMPYRGKATLADVLDEVQAGGRPPPAARVILDAVRAANETAGLAVPPSPDRVLQHGAYVDGVLHLAIQLAEALAHAHAAGIFHRDLKPSNILMSPEGRPLLLDFNLSLDEEHAVWRAGGTLPYMAPEELAALGRKSERRYDRRSDLFSLGVILYEMLAGKPPFGTIPCTRSMRKIAARLHKRQAAGPQPLRRHNPRVDGRLVRLVESCLAFDPERRPATAGALAAALRKESSPLRRTRRWMAAHRGAVLAAACVGMLLTVGAAAYFLFRPPESVREFRHAITYCEAGQDELALPCLDASLRADPGQSEALVARARLRQRQGDFRLAFADYDAAGQVAPSPAIQACKGYCLSRLALDKEAVESYRQSLEAGYDSPAVLNNLGYSCFRMGRLDEAEVCLRRALQADDTLQAPHHNLALVFLQRACEGKTVPAEALVSAQRAVEIGPESGELCRDLAFLHAWAAKQGAVSTQAAVAYVAKAVAHGIDAETFRSDPAFAALEKTPAFQDALVRRGAVREPVQAAYLIEPR